MNNWLQRYGTVPSPHARLDSLGTKDEGEFAFFSRQVTEARDHTL